MSTEEEKKRRHVSLEEKLRVIKEIEDNPEDTRATVAARLNFPVASVKSIWSAREAIKKAAAEIGPTSSKRIRSQDGKYSDLEEILFERFSQHRDSNSPMPISGPILQEKAAEIANGLNVPNFKASINWLDKFKKRHGITGRTVCGEAKSVDSSTVDHWKNTELSRLTEGYALRDIYNFDEAGVDYMALPNQTLAVKGDPCTDGKRSKQRLTVLVGANGDGSDKVRLIVIGKSAKPRCFKGVQSFPTDYFNNKKAWMNGALFRKIMDNLNDRMKREARKALAFVDNCSAHPKDMSFSNVTVVYFPPNCTARLQPLDLGTIAALKVSYRKNLIRKVLARIERGDDADSIKIRVLEAMHLLAASWSCVEAETIKKYFRRAGFDAPPSEDSNLPEDDGVDLDVGDVPDRWDSVSNGLHFNKFATFDDELAVCGTQSLEDLIKEKKSQEDESSEGEDVDEQTTETIPSFPQALQAFESSSRYLTSKNLSEGEMRVIAEYGRILYSAHSKVARQSTLTSFF